MFQTTRLAASKDWLVQLDGIGCEFYCQAEELLFFSSFSAEARIESESEVGQLEGEIGASCHNSPQSDTVASLDAETSLMSRAI